MQFIDDDMIKRIYFYCKNEDKDGIYPDEVDLKEFSHKLQTYLHRALALETVKRVAEFVDTLNPRVADAIRDKFK